MFVCVCVYLLLHKRVAYEEWYVFMSGLLLSESPGYFLLPAGSWRRYMTYLDQQLSALVCKTLWNYSDKMTSLSCFGAEETELLIEQLEVYLGACVCACTLQVHPVVPVLFLSCRRGTCCRICP